ncbi:MAG: glycosyltransferase family 39 protein, partial [Acetobacteraceae bacterium]|nr:glycosyltransferase family 39 protein [Acetobacteraceae bacterium]
MSQPAISLLHETGKPDAPLAPVAEASGWRTHGPGALVLVLILATTLVRVAAGWLMGLGVDESYVVAAGRTLHWGYFDHPPAVWWLSWAAAHLTGTDAAPIVRLPFIALFALSTWLMFRLTATLYGARAGLWAAIGVNLAPVFAVTTGGWVLPDG